MVILGVIETLVFESFMIDDHGSFEYNELDFFNGYNHMNTVSSSPLFYGYNHIKKCFF